MHRVLHCAFGHLGHDDLIDVQSLPVGEEGGADQHVRHCTLHFELPHSTPPGCGKWYGGLFFTPTVSGPIFILPLRGTNTDDGRMDNVRCSISPLLEERGRG